MTEFEIYMERMENARKARKEQELNALLLKGLQTRTKTEVFALLLSQAGAFAPTSSFAVGKEAAKA